MYFGKPLNHSVNPDEAVCAGAAIQAAILSGHRDKQIQKFFLLDVVPLNMGVNVISGLLDVVIKKNTPIPIKKTKNFTTASDDQTAVAFQVYEGDRVMSADNHNLGNFTLNNIEKAPKGEANFEVIFAIDANGILNVSAKDMKTGNKNEITINSRSLTNEEVEKMHKDAEVNRERDAITKTILDLQISFDSFCDILKKRANDKRLTFT